MTSDQMVATVRREVGVAVPDVLNYFSREEQALIRAVPIHVLWENPHDALAFTSATERVSGIYNTLKGTVEVYAEPLFRDWADDAETRASEVRRILRHEFEHVLGRNFDEYAPRDTGPMAPNWYGTEAVGVEVGDLHLTIP